MPGTFTIYYGKQYRAVFITTSRKRASVVAHMVYWMLKDDLGAKEKTLVLIEHRGKTHLVFAKCPYDERVKKIIPQSRK